LDEILLKNPPLLKQDPPFSKGDLTEEKAGRTAHPTEKESVCDFV